MGLLQTKLGIGEDKMELTFADMVLEDSDALMDYGVQEESISMLTVNEEVAEEEEEDPIPTSIDGEPCIRVFVKCEVSVVKTLTLPLDVTLTSTVRQMKKKALKKMAVDTPHMNRADPK